MVPRLLNRLFDQVNGQVKRNPFKRWLLNRAVAAKGFEKLKQLMLALIYSFFVIIEYFI